MNKVCIVCYTNDYELYMHFYFIHMLLVLDPCFWRALPAAVLIPDFKQQSFFSSSIIGSQTWVLNEKQNEDRGSSFWLGGDSCGKDFPILTWKGSLRVKWTTSRTSDQCLVLEKLLGSQQLGWSVWVCLCCRLAFLGLSFKPGGSGLFKISPCLVCGGKVNRGVWAACWALCVWGSEGCMTWLFSK